MAMGAHVLMLPAMALAMLRRRDEYTASVRGVQRLDDDPAVGFAGEVSR